MKKLLLIALGLMMSTSAMALDIQEDILIRIAKKTDLTVNYDFITYKDFNFLPGTNFSIIEKYDGRLNIGANLVFPAGQTTAYGPSVLTTVDTVLSGLRIDKALGYIGLGKVFDVIRLDAKGIASELGLSYAFSAGNKDSEKRHLVSLTLVPVDMEKFIK